MPREGVISFRLAAGVKIGAARAAYAQARWPATLMDQWMVSRGIRAGGDERKEWGHTRTVRQSFEDRSEREQDHRDAPDRRHANFQGIVLEWYAG